MKSSLPKALLCVASLQAQSAIAATWDAQILPSEQKVEVDPQSGVKIIFATTDPAADSNFYFHERCFLWDNRLMLFNSDRFGRTEVMGYLVDTGECWWVNDTMTFLGGFHHEGDREEGTVKVLDFKTGEIRIIGAGAWLENAPGYQLSQANWWHASGSPNGKWVVADNWHGTVALFNARTTERTIITTGHRVYGSKGLHLHAGWDLRGDYVEFTSNKFGNPDVCIAVIPKEQR